MMGESLVGGSATRQVEGEGGGEAAGRAATQATISATSSMRRKRAIGSVSILGQHFSVK
jgi:hypothetical protein